MASLYVLLTGGLEPRRWKHRTVGRFPSGSPQVKSYLGYKIHVYSSFCSYR